MTEEATKSEGIDTLGVAGSNSCLLSQSILQTNKSPTIRSPKSSCTNMASSYSSGIILPTALAATLNVKQKSISPVENQKLEVVTHRNNTKQYLKSAKDIQRQLTDDEDGSEDYEEDEVLMMNKPKRKCFSHETETIKPVIYKASNNFCNQEHTLGSNDEGDIEMLGETQALDVLETETQDVESKTLQGTNSEGNKKLISMSHKLPETIPETQNEGTGVSQKQVASLSHENTTHLAREASKKDQNTKKLSIGDTKSVKIDKIRLEEESKQTETEESENNNFPGINDDVCDPSPCSKPTKVNCIPDSEINIVSVEAVRTKRTRRGLAAKLPNSDEAQSLILSAGAQEAIRRSVEETKSRLELEALSDAGDKTLSEPISEVIDLDVETEELMNEQKIDSVEENMHASESRNQTTSPNNVNKKVARKSKQQYAKESTQQKCPPESLTCVGTNAELSRAVLHSKDRTDAEQIDNSMDQVMTDLKACFDKSSDDSSEDELWNRSKRKSATGSALSNSAKKGRAAGEDKFSLKLNSPAKSNPSPLASSPLNGGADKCLPETFDKSLITGIEESPVKSDNGCIEKEWDEDEGLGATVRGKKRLRQQITSDSDDTDDEEQSQSKSSVSSAFSSQTEILSTQQAKALEGDVDKLRKEIAIYEAKLGAQPVLDLEESASNDEEDDDETEEQESVRDTDSALLCKRLPDVFVIDESPLLASEKFKPAEEEKSEDDLFVSPLSPSPPSRKSKVKFPASKRPRLAEPATQVSENFLKQFQSPGGTVRKKKQLDFVQGSLNSFVSRSGNTIQTMSPGGEELKHRPSSPVLSSQRSKLLQGKDPKEAGPGNIEKSSRKICFVTS
ncbi:hypothetical protein EGW08_017356, partial [Elysia chlorotica]